MALSDKPDFLGLERARFLHAEKQAKENGISVWQIAMTSVTPGGSEYMEPARSTAFVREQFHILQELRFENHNLKKRVIELEAMKSIHDKNLKTDGYSEARLAE